MGSWSRPQVFICVLWELREILLLSSTGHVALLGEFRHLENREGKRIKQKQSQKGLSRSTWAMNWGNKSAAHLLCPPLSCSLVQALPTRARGLMTKTPKKKIRTSVKNNTICNQNKWMEDNALISQLAQPSLELMLKKWHSLVWSHPTLKLSQ